MYMYVCVPLQPCGVWETDRGEVTRHGCSSVKSLLLAGFVPVLFGDCVQDTATGCCILSGDTIIKVTTRMFWHLHYKILRERETW